MKKNYSESNITIVRIDNKDIITDSIGFGTGKMSLDDARTAGRRDFGDDFDNEF